MTNQSIAGKRSFRAILSTVIALVLIMLIFVSTALADTFKQYEVTIIDNGESITVTTTETEPIEILNTAGITLKSNDKLDITSFNEGEGGKIVISRLNTINVEFSGTIQSYSVWSPTVGNALDEIGVTVNEGDKLNYELDAEVQDGMVINIQSAFSVSLTVDGETNKYAIVEGTVQDLIALAGVQLGDDDYTKPELDTSLEAGMSVKVYRVEYKTVTQTQKIKYSTTKEKDDTLTKGTTKTVTKGVNGEADVTYSVKYVNGEETERVEATRVVTKEPVNAVVKVGTKKVTTSKGASYSSNGVTTKNGYSVGQVIKGKYTHYCACSTCNGNSKGITSSGKKIKNGMSNPYYIACNWLPLGSVISVDGVNYTVVDRGGSGLSTQGRIDIFTPEGHSACYKYGTGSCTITILRLGW
jgi:uncharacterized protein YabE (DUF348 family)